MAADPYKYFRVEARDLLDQMGKGVLDLEKGPAAPDLVARLLRFAHTLKGAARVVKLREIGEWAHAMEDALTPFRGGGVSVPRDQVDAVLKLLDDVAARLATLGPGPEPGADGTPQSPREEPARMLSADVEEIDALLEGVTEASVQLRSLRRSFAGVERARRLAELLDEQYASARERRPANDTAPRIRSMVAELRGLVDALERGLTAGVEQMDRELRQVREAAERLRLLPASLMFGALGRAVRDAAQSLGKPVVFVPKGGDVRLDAHVLTVVQSALIQAVRNAVAHGIESAPDRRAAGKKAEGLVCVEVERRGNRAAFVCRDDGRGVDLDAVRRAAERKGITSADTRMLGAEEVLRLLLSGGITTSGTVTEIAGRGIGIDVVREAASRLGGEISVETQQGSGTTLEIVVPVSLSSMDALIVEAAGQIAAIPLDAVRRTVRLAHTDLSHTGAGASISFDGTVIPFAPLARALRTRSQNSDGERPWSAVVVEGGKGLCAVGVDRLRGTERVVVRPLPELTPADAVVAGASFDAEGNPQLVLEPEGLVEEACRKDSVVRRTSTPRLPILVIDDSLTTRMLEQSILESAGYEVDLAICGEEALEKAARRRYSLFLVDVEMPGMDGFEFIERARSDPAIREVPAVLVTSRDSPEDRRKGHSAGAAAYIVKSEFDQTALLERIRTLVSSR